MQSSLLGEQADRNGNAVGIAEFPEFADVAEIVN
jgi:hypothetical protein